MRRGRDRRLAVCPGELGGDDQRGWAAVGARVVADGHLAVAGISALRLEGRARPDERGSAARTEATGGAFDSTIVAASLIMLWGPDNLQIELCVQPGVSAS